MSQVNLLPPELRERQAVRRRTALVGAIGGAVVLLILALFVFQNVRLSAVEDDLAAQDQANSALQMQIQQLQPYAELEATLAEKQALVDALYLNEVSWADMLQSVSLAIPDESYLTQLTGQISVPTGTQIGAQPTEELVGELIGNMSFSGVAYQTQTIADWLTRLEQVEGWANPWVNNAQETGDLTRIYNFDGGLDLTQEATTQRGRGGAVTG